MNLKGERGVYTLVGHLHSLALDIERNQRDEVWAAPRQILEPLIKVPRAGENSIFR